MILKVMEVEIRILSFSSSKSGRVVVDERGDGRNAKFQKLGGNAME